MRPKLKAKRTEMIKSGREARESLICADERPTAGNFLQVLICAVYCYPETSIYFLSFGPLACVFGFFWFFQRYSASSNRLHAALKLGLCFSRSSHEGHLPKPNSRNNTILDARSGSLFLSLRFDTTVHHLPASHVRSVDSWEECCRSGRGQLLGLMTGVIWLSNHSPLECLEFFCRKAICSWRKAYKTWSFLPKMLVFLIDVWWGSNVFWLSLASAYWRARGWEPIIMRLASLLRPAKPILSKCVICISLCSWSLRDLTPGIEPFSSLLAEVVRVGTFWLLWRHSSTPHVWTLGTLLKYTTLGFSMLSVGPMSK